MPRAPKNGRVDQRWRQGGGWAVLYCTGILLRPLGPGAAGAASGYIARLRRPLPIRLGCCSSTLLADKHSTVRHGCPQFAWTVLRKVGAVEGEGATGHIGICRAWGNILSPVPALKYGRVVPRDCTPDSNSVLLLFLLFCCGQPAPCLFKPDNQYHNHIGS